LYDGEKAIVVSDDPTLAGALVAQRFPGETEIELELVS
jgi:hypothetical protein